MKTIEIFRPGRFVAMSGQEIEFTEADLAASAGAYDPKKHEAPVVVGHPKDNSPAFGWVRRLTYDKTLKADLDQVDPGFAELVRAGRYKKVSASFYLPTATANPVPGVYYLRHVGFLGGMPPAVKGLKGIEFHESEDQTVTVEFEELSTRPWGEISESDYPDAESFCAACLVDLNEPGAEKVKANCKLPIREPGGAINRNALFAAQGALVGARGGVDLPPEEKRKAARKLIAIMRENDIEPTDSLVELAGETSMSEENFAEKYRETEAKLKAKEAELAELQKKLAQAEAERRLEKIVEFVEGLVTAGKILPRDKDGLIAFMAAIPECAVEFSEDGQKKQQPAMDFLKEFLARLPVQVDFTERTVGDGEEPVDFAVPHGYTVDRAAIALHRKALAYQAAHKVDYVEALRRVK